MDRIELSPTDMLYYERDKGKRFLPFIPQRGHKIFELGCAAGQLGRALREAGRAAELVGVELFPEAAEKAKRYFDTVYTGDIESMRFDYCDYFDIVICGDVIEHLRDPRSMVKKIRVMLKEDGLFISTIPNIRYWKILADLLFRGTWEYCPHGGILDATHLRFFTRSSFLSLLRKERFTVIHTEMMLHGRRFMLLNALTFRLLEEFLGEQVLVVGKKRAAAEPE